MNAEKKDKKAKKSKDGVASISITKKGVKIKTDTLNYEGDGSLVEAAVGVGEAILSGVSGESEKKDEPEKKKESKVIIAGGGQ